jgi:hypothetical protein
LRGSFLRRIEIHAVESEGYDHRGESRPLIPVNKGMIARDAETVRRSERSKVSFAIGEFADRPWPAQIPMGMRSSDFYVSEGVPGRPQPQISIITRRCGLALQRRQL